MKKTLTVTIDTDELPTQVLFEDDGLAVHVLPMTIQAMIAMVSGGLSALASNDPDLAIAAIVSSEVFDGVGVIATPIGEAEE